MLVALFTMQFVMYFPPLFRPCQQSLQHYLLVPGAFRIVNS